MYFLGVHLPSGAAPYWGLCLHRVAVGHFLPQISKEKAPCSFTELTHAQDSTDM